jgi:hypothetical protein
MINTNAQHLLSTLLALLPTADQQASLKALVSQFLESDGNARPEHTEVKSATSLSRFLNQYQWNTRGLIREVRSQTLTLLQRRYRHQRGRRPTLYASIDLTTLEKTGAFPELPISMLNGKRGLHLVVLYLTVGEVRIPWAFRVWRGKGAPSPATLALKLLRTLPAWLNQHFRVRVLTDAGFSSSPFLEGVAALKLEAVVGMRHDRKLKDGKQLHDLKRSGQRVHLEGLGIPLWAARFVLDRVEGGKEVRYVVATFQASGKTIIRNGKKRFAIEGFFKVAKYVFSLSRFGQRTARGAYRYLVLSLLAFVLAHWQGLVTGQTVLPEWRELAREVRRVLLPEVVLAELATELDRLKPYLGAHILVTVQEVQVLSYPRGGG